jgi:anti-sigma factor RsiW
MNCKELIHLLGDYVDGSMEEPLRSELDVHISMCDSCLHFLNTYDTTRIICRQITMDEIPEEFRERLRLFVMTKAREHHAGIEKYLPAAVDRRERAASIIRAYWDGRLSPALARELDSHRDRCPTCGAYLKSLNGGEAPLPLPEGLEEHIVSFLEALPPGEDPFRA